MNSAVRLLDNAAMKYANKTAIVDEFSVFTFNELRLASLRMGSAIVSRIKRKNEISPIIVFLDKSAKCVVSFMGILYSGNPYVPVAADIPMQRLEKIIQNLNPKFIITDEKKANELTKINLNDASVLLYDELVNEQINEVAVYENLDKVIDTDPIYIMYTSGSTGVPKGVTVSHKGVIDYVEWTSKTFGLNESDVIANQAPFYFDNSIFDIYGCLITGAKLIIIPEVLFNFQSKLPKFLADNNVTTIFWVPTVLINIANSNELANHKLPCLKRVLFCGEVMPIKTQPGNIIISDCTIDMADRFLHYNFFGNETWQKNRPLESIEFRNIKAEKISMPITAYGDESVPVTLKLKNVEITMREGYEDVDLVHICNYDSIVFENLSVPNYKGDCIIRKWSDGKITLNNVNCGNSKEVKEADKPFFSKSI